MTIPYAQLDQNNTVIKVVQIPLDECCDVNGVESEELGIYYCKKLFGVGTVWKKTSYDGSFRKTYGDVGYLYDESRDAFITPRPVYESWILNEDTMRWEPPIPRPELTQENVDSKSFYQWDEESKQWVLETPTE